jgi:hypothetical protein
VGNFGVAVPMTVPHLGPATYYVTIYRYDGSGSYTLSDTFAQKATKNDTEPNDTYSQTTTSLAVGKSTTGHLGYSRTSYNDIDTVDFYKVVIPADGDLTFTVSPDPTLRVYLYFYDTNGASGVTSTSVGNFGIAVPMTVPHLGPGTYYVAVIRYDGYGGYSLGSSIKTPPEANDTEPDDAALTTPDTLPPGASTTGHLGYSRTSYNDIDTIDYYKVVIPADGDLTFRVTPDPTLRVYLYFYDTNGASGVTSTSVGNFGAAVTMPVVHLGPGTYYVAVLRYDGYGGYTFDSFWNRQPFANDSEPNDSFQTAQPFSSGTGHLGYSRTSYNDIDTVDFYSLTGSGTLSVTAQPTSTLRIYLYLYDANGSGVTSTGVGSFGAAVTLTAQNLPSGTYYLAVLRYDGYGAYSFSGPVPVSISGTITLQSCLNQKDIPIRFRFRPTDGSPSFDLTAFLAADGSYTIPDVPASNYNLAIKGVSWLQKVLIGVDASGGSVTGVNATLRPGDINNDNAVTIDDLGLLADAFNSDPTSSTWNVNADLNRDGKVNILDLGLLADNFNKNGDP